MGLLSGSLTYMRGTIVNGELPDGVLIKNALDLHRFRPIDAHSDVEVSIGFCGFDDVMDEPPEYPDDNRRMAMRLDTLKVAGPTLKQHVRTAEKARCLELNREKLSKKERERLALEVKKALRLKILPKSLHVQIVFDGADVYVFASSRSVLGYVLEWLEMSFEVAVRPVTAMSLACEVAGRETIAKLEPARLHLIRR
jgi:hypothetical protein